MMKMKTGKCGRLIALLLVMIMVGCSFSFAFAEQQNTETAMNGNEQSEGVQDQSGDINEVADPSGDVDESEGDAVVPDGEETNDDNTSGRDEKEDEDVVDPENDGQKTQEDELQNEDGVTLLVKENMQEEDPLKIEITSITSDIATGDITLKWTPVKGAASYVIFRAKAGGDFKKLATTKKCHYKNRNAVPRTKYAYKVVARIEKNGKVIKRVSSSVKYKTASGIGNVGEITTYPGYQSVTMKWKKVKDAKYYEIVRWDSSTNTKVKLENATTKGNTSKSNKNYIVYKDNGARGGNVKYAYSIWAVRTVKVDGKTVVIRSQVRSATPTVMCVRQMYQTIYLDEDATLSSHAGPSVTRTFYAGTPIVTTGFGGGKFKFWYNGSLFYANYTRVSYATCDYSRYDNYPSQTAVNFVNELTRSGQVSKSSSSNYFIWVSTYTQHLYILRWNSSTSSWTLDRDWEVSTGGAGSPTRIDLNLDIEDKWRYFDGINYWNCFSGRNAIHGKRDEYVIDGAPHSHGCVRNYNSNAGWIFDNCPMGTPIAIY